MLSGKVEKRIASSLFITLAPPRRDPMVKGEIRPQKALPLPAMNTGSNLPRTSVSVANRGMGRSLAVVGSPNGGCSTWPAPPILPSHHPVDPELDVILAPSSTSWLGPNPISVEAATPDLQKRMTVLPTPLQSSMFPTESRQPKTLLSSLGQVSEGQMVKAVSPDICAFCHKDISCRAPVIEAMNKQYHADCFMCRTCHQALAGQRYYQKEGRPICKACYNNTLEKCARCQTLILNQIVRAMGNGYHPECFTCVVCSRAIRDETFAVDDEDAVHCLDDFYRKYASMCSACEKPIIPREGKDSYKIECMGQNFHEGCYRCESCRVPLDPEPTENGCYPLDNSLFCKSCNIRQRKESSS